MVSKRGHRKHEPLNAFACHYLILPRAPLLRLLPRLSSGSCRAPRTDPETSSDHSDHTKPPLAGANSQKIRLIPPAMPRDQRHRPLSNSERSRCRLLLRGFEIREILSFVSVASIPICQLHRRFGKGKSLIFGPYAKQSEPPGG